MQIIRPVTVTDSILTSTNVAENDFAAWAVGTTYNTGDKVIVVSTHSIYESLIDGNVGNDPTTDDGTKWLRLSATNRWKAFDQKISDPVVNTNSIEYTLNDPSTYITGVALFGLKGVSANVTVTDTTSGGDGEVYNETVELLDNVNIIDWYTYFFAEQPTLTEALFLNIPPYLSADVEITVTDASGEDAELGQIVIGFTSDLGLTTYGTSVSIEDFSRKETDAFGNFIVVERDFANLVDFDVRYETGRTREIQKTLAQYRATPIVYLGNEDDTEFGTVVYGFYRRFDLTIESPSYSFAAIEVEGLT